MKIARDSIQRFRIEASDAVYLRFRDVYSVKPRGLRVVQTETRLLWSPCNRCRVLSSKSESAYANGVVATTASRSAHEHGSRVVSCHRLRDPQAKTASAPRTNCDSRCWEKFISRTFRESPRGRRVMNRRRTCIIQIRRPSHIVSQGTFFLPSSRCRRTGTS